MDPRGKLAVITGASRGIGEAAAKALAMAGAKVILLARTQADLDKVVAEIEGQGGKAMAYALDLAEPEQVREVCQKIRTEQGDPDILINNAGLGRWLYVEETSHEEARQMANLPYLAAFYITHEFLPAMLKRKSGHILSVNSPACLSPWPGAVAYISSRWALRGFTEALRMDLHGTGIGVTHCILGKVESHYFINNPGTEDRLPGISKMIPNMTPEQAAAHILKGIKRNKKHVVAPTTLWFIRQSYRVFPGITKMLTRRTGHKRS